MDLEHLERLALSTDRTTALATLLPGTVDHDYWRGVFLLHDGRLDEVREILDGWTKRHGQKYDPPFAKLHHRHLLLRANADLAATSAELSREADLVFDDRADVVEKEQRFPTKLDPALVDGTRLAREEVQRRPDLSTITDVALPD